MFTPSSDIASRLCLLKCSSITIFFPIHRTLLRLFRSVYRWLSFSPLFHSCNLVLLQTARVANRKYLVPLAHHPPCFQLSMSLLICFLAFFPCLTPLYLSPLIISLVSADHDPSSVLSTSFLLFFNLLFLFKPSFTPKSLHLPNLQQLIRLIFVLRLCFSSCLSGLFCLPSVISVTIIPFVSPPPFVASLSMSLLSSPLCLFYKI